MKLPPFKLERYFARHEFSAPCLLCASDCESMELQELLALEPGSAERFESLWLGYTDSLGNPELRQAIAATYERVNHNQILVHTGAEEAIFNFMNVALSPGDHIIVQAPYYQSLGEVARSTGAEVSPWEGNPAQGWELDIDMLKTLLRADTRVVVVNFPHNPTGFLPSSAFMRELAQLADQHGFIIFSDEVYRGLELDPADRLPAAVELSNQAVSLGVMSKSYGLAGLRIGWVATSNAKLFNALAAFKDYTTICNSAPSEFLATLALRNGAAIEERNRMLIRENLDRLDDFFGAHAERFSWYRPKAGPIAFPALLQEPVDRFCTDLLENGGLLLLPGTLYGENYNSFRIGFGRKNLGEALQRFEDYLRKSR
jgi:aspartate/methionine/tyrosine aminotransferase